MPIRNLTKDLDRFVLQKLEGEERPFEAKLTALRKAIDAGDASGIADGKVFEPVRETLKLPKTRCMLPKKQTIDVNDES